MPIGFSVDISGFDLIDATRRQSRLDRVALSEIGRAVEVAGFDRLLLSDGDGTQDVATLAAWIVHATSGLGMEIEHRAGRVDPEIAARQIATLDQLSGGRLALRVVPPTGEGLSHEESLARLDEYLVLLKRLWSNDRSIDHEGRFYRLKSAFSAAKPFNGASVPLVLDGVSGTALQVAARHAEVFLLPAATVQEVRQTIERVRAAATAFGRVRAIRFALPIRPVDASSGMHGYLDAGVTDFIVAGVRSTRELSAFGGGVARQMRAALDRQEDAGRPRSPAANVAFRRWSRSSR